MDTQNIKVRTGVPEDVDGMMQLALAACEENGLTRPSPPKLLNEIWAGLNRDHGIVGVIGPVGGKLEAAILLRTEALWYSEDMTLVERAVFVAPEFRGAKIGRANMLCDFAKAAARGLGMPLVIGIITSDRARGKVALYQRHFGPEQGAYWIYGAKTGAWKEAAQ